MSSIGKVEPVSITSEMERSYLDYAMSVIVARALPDVRDGLKPVHRRILYAMKRLNLNHNARFSKSAKVVGEVLGKYHPHGDMPVYDALVRLAQDFSMRYPLVNGQGNFGSIDGDPPAAMRYTEVKLERIADEMLRDIDKETVPFSDNFDRSLKEPDFLPARLPNLLLMGAEGIAVGMATKIPPHNLGEVINALMLMIDNSKVSKESDDYKLEIDVDLDGLMEFIKGPDFPTKGIIFDQKTIKEAYAVGRASIIMRGVANIEDAGSGKKAIIVSQLPYQVNKANLVVQIATLVKNKRLDGIAVLRDESDRRGIRIYIELKRNTRPKASLNSLFKLTPLQTSFPVNMVALVRGTPQTLSLKTILTEYLRHRLIVISKRSQFELSQAKTRAHILEGLKIALDNLDAVIETIKKSKTAETAKTNLMAKFKLSSLQAQAILDLQLRRLAALERQKIEDEYQLMLETIAYLQDLLAHPAKIMMTVKDELQYLGKKYADERRTRVVKGKIGEFKEADLVPNTEMVICLTRSGYIKRMERQLFKTQLRGGKGVSAMTTKETDVIDHIITANNHDQILFFSNLGKVYQLRVFEIPKTSRVGKGIAVINLIGIESHEQIQSVLTYPIDKNGSEKFIILATKNGVVKKTALEKFAHIRSNGLIAIKLDKDDTLRWVRLTYAQDNILLVSKFGQAIVFNEKQVRTTGRDTRGVSGQKLRPKDSLVSMQSFADKSVKEQKLNLLVITTNGLGKRTLLSEFKSQNRGGLGVKAAKINAKTGPIAACFIINPQKTRQVIITSSKAQTIKVELKNIPCLKRHAQGVILMRFAKKGNKVADAAPLLK